MKNSVKYGLVVFMMICLALVFTACDDGDGGGSGPKDNVPGKTFAEKLAWVNGNAENEGEYFITAGANESIGTTTLSCNGATDVKITIRGGKVTITVEENSWIYTKYLFTVNDGITLILSKTTLQGLSSGEGPTASVEVKSGGTLIMETGSKITGNRGSSGVYVNGEFIMKGGEISGNNIKGGVYISGGTFTMNSGKISGNTNSSGGGGVCIYYGGTFIMNGGAISGNEAYGNNRNGGGVFLDNGTFTMNGGTISGNEVSAGSPSGSGGGVAISSGTTFNMKGGEIFGNKTNGFGGGVYVSSGTFRISNGTIYGKDAKEAQRNISNYYGGGGSALQGGTAEYGTFDGDDFTKIGALNLKEENTIKVVDGVLQP